jgi:glucokinase
MKKPMHFTTDKRIVMTLDAGGTNFVFSAIQGGEEIAKPIRLPSYGHDLDLCLNAIISGFKQIDEQLPGRADAISFAFPGPSDYRNGIIGDLQNLPAFRGGVALGPMLEDTFKIPVIINNDGDLYAYGEAIGGFLPYINLLLEKSGTQRRFKNLVGFTLGTGLGGGIVIDGEMLYGDNSGASEVTLLRNKLHPKMNVEESVSIRAIQMVYAKSTGISFKDVPTPKEIFEIGTGKRTGDREAAIKAFETMGEVLGDAIGNVLTIIDGLAVIGGGIAGAYLLFCKKMINEINSSYQNSEGERYQRLFVKAFNLEDKDELNTFLKGDSREITIPGSNRKILYDPFRRVGIGLSKIGTNKAVALGAYAIALKEIS